MRLPARSPLQAAVWGTAAGQFLSSAAIMLASAPIFALKGDGAALLYGAAGSFCLFVGVEAARAFAAAVRS